MYKDLFVKMEVKLKEENEIFSTHHFITASPPAMLLESQNKLRGSKSVKALKEMANIAHVKYWQVGAAGSCEIESTGI